MLRLHPDKRAKASDLVHHNWLEAVLVQGEIDVIRRLEMDEAVKRRGLEERERQQEQQEEEPERSSKERLLDQSERDAMKPVDESMTSVNGLDEDDDEEEEEEEEEEEDEDEEGGGGGGSSRKRLKHQAPILGAPPIPTMASGIARALQQSNANANPSSATTTTTNNNRTSGSASAGSKRRT